MLEVSQGHISSLNISRVEENIKIINDTFDNLKVSGSNAWKAYWKYRKRFSSKSLFYLLKNKQNAENTMRTFAEFLFTFGRFPRTIDHLPIIPTRETPSFVKESDIISSSWLYWNFNYGDRRGLVSVHFLAALNIYFGENRALSKDTISEFFHNLSLQALSKSDDSIVVKFDALKNLNKNIYMQKKRAVIIEIKNLHRPTIVGDNPTINNKYESILVKEISISPTDVDGNDNVNINVSDIPLPKVPEKIEPEVDDFGVDLQKLFEANIRSNYEPVFNNVIGVNNWVNKIKEDHEMRDLN